MMTRQEAEMMATHFLQGKDITRFILELDPKDCVETAIHIMEAHKRITGFDLEAWGDNPGRVRFIVEKEA